MTQITTWYILLPVALGFGVYESLWRRWFGGKELPKWLKWMDRRFVKHCINTVALFSVCFFVRGLAWYWSAYAALVFQILFWTTTFGMYFDIGRSGRPITEYDIEEYNKSWFSPILNWFFSEKQRYTPFYDYIGMFIRFTSPLLLLFWLPSFNSGLLFLGTIVSVVYGLGWTLFEKGKLTKTGPTELAEYLSGFFAGLYWVVSV